MASQQFQSCATSKEETKNYEFWKTNTKTGIVDELKKWWARWIFIQLTCGRFSCVVPLPAMVVPGRAGWRWGMGDGWGWRGGYEFPGTLPPIRGQPQYHSVSTLRDYMSIYGVRFWKMNSRLNMYFYISCNKAIDILTKGNIKEETFKDYSSESPHHN